MDFFGGGGEKAKKQFGKGNFGGQEHFWGRFAYVTIKSSK